jgi:hypothetical protein
LFVNPINISTDHGIKKGAHKAGEIPANELSIKVNANVKANPINPIFILLFMVN